MNAISIIPAIPTDWLAHSGVVPAGNGYRTHVKTVLHKASEGSYHPFVVHTAYENDIGEWAYEQGSYCFTEEEGRTIFAKRNK